MPLLALLKILEKTFDEGNFGCGIFFIVTSSLER